MRILFDSKNPQFKTPFGCLTPNQDCTLTIYIPASVQATEVTCVLCHEHGKIAQLIMVLSLIASFFHEQLLPQFHFFRQ